MNKLNLPINSCDKMVNAIIDITSERSDKIYLNINLVKMMDGGEKKSASKIQHRKRVDRAWNLLIFIIIVFAHLFPAR